MADEIIDLSRIIARRAEGGAPAGTMTLWGADGERSRFALPLWRVVHLAGAERGVLFWQRASDPAPPRPFVVLDTAHDPARLDVPDSISVCVEDASGELHDLGQTGLVVCLGTKSDRAWAILADGGQRRAPLTSRKREDILFLAGECAGLLFLRDFAEEAGD
jgi:hypothetical protein